MRSFLANQQPVFYKLLTGQEEILDQDGNATGQFLPQYGPLRPAMLCVSPNKGRVEAEEFGTLLDYDRTMTTADTECEIDENTVLWVDGADTSGPYNAVVRQRAVWKNSVQYAIKRVTVREYQQEQEQRQAADRLRARREANARENSNEAESQVSRASLGPGGEV